MTRVALLGSTGSIGTQTLRVARHLRDRVEIVALAGGWNTRLLSRQIEEFRPRMYHSVVPFELSSAGSCQTTLEEIVTDEHVDAVVVATGGHVGLKPTLAALRHGKRVALANKEVLVMAGAQVMETASRSGAELIPVDSEHSAIWQCIRGEPPPHRIILTASGGPFFDYSSGQLDQVTADEALAHPVWSMGSKITIDSATMMNKGLEIIEARWLFEMPYDQIDVLIHRECLVHSMVEFIDGSVKAQLSMPDMALSIQYALTYPDRVAGAASPLPWDMARTLSFEPADSDRFPCLKLARDAGKAARTYPAVLCGADEAAVELFLHGTIGFQDIARMVDSALDAHEPGDASDLDSILAADEWARRYVHDRYGTISSGSET